MPKDPSITGFALGPFETNCYVVADESTKSCWIIDAGFAPKALIKHVRAAGLTPEAVILTHAHADHIAGLAEVRAAWPGVPILIHEAEQHWLTDPRANLSASMEQPLTAPEADRLLKGGERLTLGGSSWEVLHTPGHSPGGISLVHEMSDVALVGDTLFAGSIGRTDLPGGDFETLKASIREHLYSLPPATRVLSGHGPQTTIGRERSSNPFVRG